MDDETRTTGPKEAYAGFRIDAGKSVPLLGSDPRLPCAEGLPVDKAPPRPDQEPGPRREASRPGRDDRVEISPPGPAAALGFPRVNDGPRLRRVWGLLLASGLILAVLGMGLQNEGGRSLAGTPARPIRVLVLDWLNDPVLEALRSQDYLGLCPSFLVNTREKEFWARLNNSGQVKVFARSPSHPIQDSLREIEPDVVVLANICLDLEDRWGLGRDERIDLIQYLERGHGLVVTKGSLFDMRAELMDSQSSDLWIGPYGHVNRLHTDLPGWEKWRREYDSSIAAMCGLGLLPIYEEAREKVAKYVWEVGCADPEPLSKAALMALATLIHNAPLLPTGVPFNGDMEWGPGSGGHPILDGLGEAFSLDLVCPVCKNLERVCSICTGTGSARCPGCLGAGWLLPPVGCLVCDNPGSGDTPGDGNCRGCHGTGVVECAICHGTGKVGPLSCAACQGRGWNGCLLCGGSGNRPGDGVCRGCGGDGYSVDGAVCQICDGEGEIACPACGGMGSVGPERCPYCGGDGRADSTLVGWQLEYPFLFAERAVNRTAAAMDKAQVYLESGPYSALNWTYAQRAQDWQWQGVLRQDPEIDPGALQDALEKSVEVMHSLLQGIYQARLDMASEIVIPLNLSFGDFTFYREVTIPVPVELHRVFRPARIVAWSVDGLAAVLSHEVSGLSLGGEKVSYRSVYFSFAPELGGEVCERLMRNAVIWCSEALDPDEVDAGVRIGNTTIYPSSSVLTDPASAVETRNFVVSTDRNATYPVPAGAGEIEIYWDPGSGLGVCPPDGWWIDSSIPGRIVVLGPPGGNGYLTLYSAQTAGLHQDVAVLAVIERHLSIIVALVVGASLAHLASPKAIQGRGCTGGLSAARCLVD